MFCTHQYLQTVDSGKTQTAETISHCYGSSLVVTCSTINSLIPHIDDLSILRVGSEISISTILVTNLETLV